MEVPVPLRPLSLHYPGTTASGETTNRLQYTAMPNGCFHNLFGKEVCLSAVLTSWNAVHDLTGISLCCVEKKPATVRHNHPWSWGVCGVLTFISRHTQIHGWDWGFTLELPAGYCGCRASDLLLNSGNFGLTNSDVQISSAESSSGSGTGNLVLELKSTNSLSWMAFMEEKETGVEPVRQHSLRFTEILATAGGFSEYGVPAGVQPMSPTWPQPIRFC